MNNRLKIVVIGGGSSYTPELVEGLIKRFHELPIAELHLVDIEDGKHKLDIIYDLTQRMIAKAGLCIEVRKTVNRREALSDADFVVTQIRVGGLKCRANDEKLPLKHNLIGQETNGAGGFAKALRTIPAILDICKDIEELAPNAWLINFTNPAGIITEAVTRYSKVKVIGLCNVPLGMINNVAQILEVASSRINIDFVGLNHMVFGKDIYLDGNKITDLVLKRVCDGAYMSMNNIPDLNWSVDFIKALRLLPCPYHRYYFMTDKMLDEERKAIEDGSGVRAEQVQKIEHELFELYKEPMLDVKPAVLEKRGGAYYSEAAVSLISSIHNDKKAIHAVNVRNNSAIANLPEDVIVEVNAVIGRNGAIPITTGQLPIHINGLIQSIKSFELLTVEAAVLGDYYKALMALTINPLIGAIDIAKKVLDEILQQNISYLPQFKKELREKE
ncbi:MAG: 6-phospho-beta-glucosidase [Clostridiales bacterium GWB2_37_7]|nr:MAG: 6-phospho-beta-glucosidase [Clostridiales bacterium GWB2_37_7]